MKNRKWLQAVMAGVLSAAMLTTSVSVWGAEFNDGAAEETAVEAFSAGDAKGAKGAEVAIDAENFPDEAFRNYVWVNFDTDENDMLSDAEMAAVKTINMKEKGIKDLTGVEYFPELKELFVAGNELTEVNLTKNTKLTDINLGYNKLTGTLDLSKCTNMVNVRYTHNALTKVLLPDYKYLKKVNYIDASFNKFKTQTDAGLKYIAYDYMKSLDEVNVRNNYITSFNCSGFEGILDIRANRITKLSGGARGYQAVAIYAEGKYNTLKDTDKVDFSVLGNRVPQRFTCNPEVRSKVVMVTPKLSVSTDWDKITVTVGASDYNAAYVLQRKTGSGSYKTVATWKAGELYNPEFGENQYVDKDVKAGQKYYYKLTTTVKVQNGQKVYEDWSKYTVKSAYAYPAAPTISSIVSSKKGYATVKWKEVKGATGYAVYYGASASKATTAVTRDTNKLYVHKNKLTSGKTYYFRVRAFKDVNGKRVYAPFCTAKAVKVK